MAVIRRGVLSILGASLALLTACGDDGGTPSSCLPECPASRGYDAESYHLSARFDWTTSTLHAVEDLTLAGLETPIVELDADVDVTEVRSGSQRLAFANDRDAGTLHVDLGPVIGDGTPVTFTVEYTAPLSDALRIGGPRDDDPITARLLYTDSEPDRGLRWLVAKHDPADRALWSVDVTAPTTHDVIANGRRVDDQQVGGQRLVSYTLPQPIPTYLMAFATGELEHVERTSGRVPLALWFRRGVVLDPQAHLDLLAEQMATFDALIGPYPWESYAVVLIPGFGGGMENATITFNDESSGQGPMSFGLNAHELAHQWFGDWVTMRTYDDVWVKEGMATFLAAEATRARRDRMAVGRFFGNDFGFFPGDAIVDPTLSGLAKYTSGPYERAAWLITQIRALVGDDDAFWAALRRVQTEHMVGDVSGAEFLASFPLTEAQRARLTASLPAQDTAYIAATVTPLPATGVTAVSLVLADPLQLIASPLEVVVIDASGAATTTTLTEDGPTELTVPDGGYLVTDPRGVHPSWPDVFASDDSLFELIALATPTAAAARADFLQRSPSHQEIGLAYGAPLPPAADFAAFYDGLDSLNAQRSTIDRACGELPFATPPDAATLIAALTPLLRAPPIVGFSSVGGCDPSITEPLIGAELDAASVAITGANAARVEYLMSLDAAPALALARFGRIATTAPTLRLRDLALQRLWFQTLSFVGYTPVPSSEQPAWRAFFRDRYPAITSSTRLQRVWRGSQSLGDVEALPLLATRLHTVPMAEGTQARLVCDAMALASTEPGALEAFQAATMPWGELWPAAAAALADPSQCQGKRRDPRALDVDADGPHDHVRHLHPR